MNSVHPSPQRNLAVSIVTKLAGLSAVLLLQACSAPTADIVFLGGTIYTADDAMPRAEAVAVSADRIVFVGAADDAEAWIAPATEIVDLQGRMLLPGFHDTHVHPISGGVELNECDLNPAETLDDIEITLRACAERPGEWLRGGGFALPIFPNGAPPKELLDAIVPDRPAYLSSLDGHSAWVNSRALAIAGIDAETPDPPPDGVIVRMPNGEPQGTLRESAMELVAAHVPPHSSAELVAGLERALEMAAGFGITTLHEANAREPELRAYRAAESENALTARVLVALATERGAGPEQVAGLVALRERYASALVRPVAAKIFADGVIEGQTAALLADYTDRPGFRGELNVEPEALKALVGALDEAGFKVHVHAIGDRAIRVTLDAFAARHAIDDGAGPRHIMAHVQLFAPSDIPRLAELGVVASFQPLWHYADTYIRELTEPRLGPERSRWLYPMKSVAATGAIVAAGSDWSVTSMNPMLAIEVAITRRDPDAGPGPAWIPEERVDLETMLRAYTIAGAMAGDLEDETGSITAGKKADLVVLDRNLFEITPQEISETEVDMTLLEGRVVYRRAQR